MMTHDHIVWFLRLIQGLAIFFTGASIYQTFLMFRRERKRNYARYKSENVVTHSNANRLIDVHFLKDIQLFEPQKSHATQIVDVKTIAKSKTSQVIYAHG